MVKKRELGKRLSHVKKHNIQNVQWTPTLKFLKDSTKLLQWTPTLKLLKDSTKLLHYQGKITGT